MDQTAPARAFYGTSENAVKTQVWIAIATYLFVAILKKQLDLPHSLYTILQVLSVSVFENLPIQKALTGYLPQAPDLTNRNQLSLFV